jgi:hypothetical protein
MFRTAFLGCSLVVVGLLTGCGSSGSASSDDQGEGALVNGSGDQAAGDPTDQSPLALKLSCDLKNEKYSATAKGDIKIGSENKILPGTTITMKINSFPSADLTVKSGSVVDMDKKQGDIVLVWKKLGIEAIEATMKYDGVEKHGSSTSSLGDYDFDAQCTFDRN